MRLVIIACIALAIAGCKSKEPEQSSIDPALSKILYAGEVVYIENCATCHQLDSLVKRPIVNGDKKALLSVHPFDTLKVEDVSNVLTFIRNSFGNRGDMISIEDVKTFKNPPSQNQ